MVVYVQWAQGPNALRCGSCGDALCGGKGGVESCPEYLAVSAPLFLNVSYVNMI